jgi:hypothetical protein
MNHSPNDQQSMSLTPETEELTTPHFDDSAVATAHQVEPLPRRAVGRFESSRYVLTIASAIAVGIILGIGAVVISSGSRSDNSAPPVFAEASAQMDSLDDPAAAQAAAMDSSAAARDAAEVRDTSAAQASSAPRNSAVKPNQDRPQMPRARARRPIDRYMAEEFGDAEDDSPRRTARRVGVLYYGRGRNEP